MGGLIDGSTVKGDLWMVESSGGNLSCFQIATVSEGPGPRVGHASLLVGNAFIVFGGDTKINENDALDDTLYLLNTCTFAIRDASKQLTDSSDLQLLVNGLVPSPLALAPLAGTAIL